jgi:hypothetical protein
LFLRVHSHFGSRLIALSHGDRNVIQSVQHTHEFDDDKLVEIAAPAAFLAPDGIADAGLVHQGGLRRLLPWLFGG